MLCSLILLMMKWKTTMDNNKWHYIGKGLAVAVAGAGVCVTAIMLKEPQVLLALFLVAIIANQWRE
jgi:hypothetical protein